MTDKKKDRLISGFVKSIPFAFPANIRIPQPLANVRDAVSHFARNCARIVKATGLSYPAEDTYPNITMDLCIKATGFVSQALADPSLIGIPFTIIDCTPWADVKENKRWGRDIVFISVFWRGNIPVVAVMLGDRKYIKGESQYHLEIEQNRQCIIFEFEGYFEVSALPYIQAAVTRSYNYLQLADFGGVIHEAVLTTCNSNLEYPVAAATYLNERVYYADRPRRHHHIVQSKEYHEAKDNLPPTDANITYPSIQGFLTNHGNFITRYRGMYKAHRGGCVIDTMPILIDITTSEKKHYEVVDRAMGGILRQEDETGTGYLIAVTPLFSEDLW
jgi:hypothetical protein